MTLTSKDLSFNHKTHRYWVTDTQPKRFLPSVTTITGLLEKNMLVEWAAREASTAAVHATIQHDGMMDDEAVDRLIAIGRQAHRDKRTEGANVGTAVHQQIRMMLQPGWAPEEGEAADGGIEAEMAMISFDQWYTDQVVERGSEVVLCEQMVVHPTGLYCGTFDLLLRTADNKLVVADYKTTNSSESNQLSLYPEYCLQIAAYREALIASPEFDHLLGDATWGGAQVVAVGKQGQLGCTELEVGELDRYAEAFMLLANLYPTYREIGRRISALNREEKKRRETTEEKV